MIFFLFYNYNFKKCSDNLYFLYIFFIFTLYIYPFYFFFFVIGPLNLDDVDVDEAQDNPIENMNLNESNVKHEVTMGDSFGFFNEGIPKNDNDLVYVPWP